MIRCVFRSLVLLTVAALPADAGSLLEPPADALRVEFVSPDTSPTERLKAGQPLTVGVVVTGPTGAVQVVPTSTPDWMTYDPKTREFSGVPLAGEHELAVKVMDAGTGQTATGILDFEIEER
ncbi:cadherin-like domain-containing protein [Rhizobium sp. N541]|nr:cadherin-like domain-containing protein [Rhizobium sp. N541]ANM23302.1 cadherin-like domain-containing protein [Rhizobium sp. N941]